MAIKFDIKLLPGTRKEWRENARKLQREKIPPIAIIPKGHRWEIVVLGETLGIADTRDEAESVAFQVGNYVLDLGSFVYTYTAGAKGYKK